MLFELFVLFELFELFEIMAEVQGHLAKSGLTSPLVAPRPPDYGSEKDKREATHSELREVTTSCVGIRRQPAFRDHGRFLISAGMSTSTNEEPCGVGPISGSARFLSAIKRRAPSEFTCLYTRPAAERFAPQRLRVVRILIPAGVATSPTVSTSARISIAPFLCGRPLPLSQGNECT